MLQHFLNSGTKRLPVLLLSMTLSFSSCYTYRISTQAQPGTEALKPIHANSFFWGLVQNPKTLTTPNCDSLDANGMAEVTMKTNLGYSLITVATLGIWSPMKIIYKCGKPCKKTDTL